MTVSPTLPTAPGPNGPGDRARTPEEAAEQFEAVLVRQFVSTMTKGLFESTSGSLPGAQADAQREAMTDALTKEIVESGTLRFRDLLLRQWDRTGQAETGAEAPPAETPAAEAAPPAAPASAAGDDHFRLLHRAARLG